MRGRPLLTVLLRGQAPVMQALAGAKLTMLGSVSEGETTYVPYRMDETGIEQLDGDGKVQVGNHATPRAQPRVGRDQTQESPVLGAHHGAAARP